MILHYHLKYYTDYPTLFTNYNLSFFFNLSKKTRYIYIIQIRLIRVQEDKKYPYFIPTTYTNTNLKCYQQKICHHYHYFTLLFSFKGFINRLKHIIFIIIFINIQYTAFLLGPPESSRIHPLDPSYNRTSVPLDPMLIANVFSKPYIMMSFEGVQET